VSRSPIRVLVADDEAPARAKLRRLLAAEPDVEIVAEASDGEEAVAAIRSQAPDLVFLDVQMPRLDGFGVIAAVGAAAMPAVVFVTAYDEHALRAFEVHALDYLLKPFAPARLAKVLDRVRGQRRVSPDLAERLERLLAEAAQGPGGAPRHLQRLLVAAGPEREVLLPVARIDLVRADANYLEIHAGGQVYRRRGPLAELAARLDPEQFLQINRSELVRLDAVAELQPWFHGDYRVILKSGAQLTWSRRYRAKEKERFE
jgi:two-component system LytT family response regulator